MADGTQIRITAVDQTTAAFRSVQNNINTLQSGLRSIAGPLAAAFSVAAITGFSKSLIDAADRLTEVSEQTGIAVKELSALGNAAVLNGASSDQMNQALVKLNRSISEAAGGAKEQQQAFQAVGISASELSRLTTTEVFFKISDAFAGAENGANKTAIAMALLGRSGAELIPVLNQGSQELQKYSATFSDDFAVAAATFNDNLDKIIISFKTFGAEALTPVLKEINKFIDFIRGFAAVAKEEGFWKSLLGMTEIGEWLGIGVGDKVTKEIQKIQDAQKKIPAQVGKNILPPPKVDMTPIDELVERNKELVEVYNKTRQPVDVLSDGLAQLDRLYQQGLISLDQYLDGQMALQETFQKTQPSIELNNSALKRYIDTISDVRAAMDNMAVKALQNLEDALLGVMTGTMSLKDAFKSMAQSIISDLIRIAIQRSITGPIADAIFGATAGGEGYFAGIGGARALGGPVSRDTPYLVGERGPELFVPNQSGSIVPNNQMGGGESININQTINVTTGVQQTVRVEIAALMPQIQEATKAAVLDAKQRGGRFAATFK